MVLRKIRDQYKAYCTIYKMHAMATCHGGAGCPLDRGLDILIEDPEHTNIDNDISGHSHASTDTAAQVIMIHIEAVPDHNIGIIATTTGVAHNAQIPHTGAIAIDPTVTYPHRPYHRSSTHRSSSYHSRDRSCSHSCPSYKSS